MTRMRTKAACLASAERDLRLHKLARQPRHKPRQDNSDCSDEDAYGHVPKPTPELIAEANRQWANIPDNPAELSAWMRGEPINPPWVEKTKGETK